MEINIRQEPVLNIKIFVEYYEVDVANITTRKIVMILFFSFHARLIFFKN